MFLIYQKKQTAAAIRPLPGKSLNPEYQRTPKKSGQSRRMSNYVYF